MKFVCERCHTKYSIADEKVRGKVLKVRCKTCATVITVRETGASAHDTALAPREAALAQSGSFDAGKTVKSAGPAAHVASAHPPVAGSTAPASPAVAAPRRGTAPVPPLDNVEWFLAVDGAQTGPFPRSRVIDKILAAAKDADVHVWRADFDGWKAPPEVVELAAELTVRRRRPTPAPPPLRRPTGPVAIAAASEAPHPDAQPASSDAPTAALAALDLHAEPAHLPAPGHKKNGVASAEATAGALANFGVHDILGEAGEAPTPRPAAAAPAVIPAAVALASPMASPAPAAVARASDFRIATSIAGTTKTRPVKLWLGAAAVATVLCGLVVLWMFQRPVAPPAVAVVEPAAGKSAPVSGGTKKLADDAVANKPAEIPVPPAPVPAAPPAAAAAPITARIEASPAKAGKGRPRRRGVSTSPPPLTAAGTALTAEQRDAASRFGEATGRDVRIPTSTAAAAHTTPAQGDISRVINSNRQGIQTCYQRALLRDNTLTHGKVTVRVSIGLSGKVKNVSLDAPAQFRALEPCIRDVMSRWAFPPSSEEYGTEFPVVLQGNQ